jgi:hypothetical protein
MTELDRILIVALIAIIASSMMLLCIVFDIKRDKKKNKCDLKCSCGNLKKL